MKQEWKHFWEALPHCIRRPKVMQGEFTLKRFFASPLKQVFCFLLLVWIKIDFPGIPGLPLGTSSKNPEAQMKMEGAN